MPASRSASGGAKPLYFVIGGVALVVIGLLGATFFLVVKTTQEVAHGRLSAPPVQAQAVAPAAPQPSAPAPAAPPPTTTAQATPPPAAQAAPDDDDDRSSNKHKGNKRKASRDSGGGGREEHASAPPPPPPPSGPVKASLSKDDIFGVVRENASRAAPCLKAARAKNEIPAGRHTFTLDWVIRPNGSVADAHLKGPPYAMNTSLPSCFAAVLTQWHFPASQSGAPISNFPFGPITLP